MSVSVVIAEDNLLLREGLRLVLDSSPGIEVVAMAEDLAGLQREVDERRPGVVVSDLRMPPEGRDEGLQAAQWLHEHHPDVGLVLLSQYLDPAVALALLGNGARGRGYVLKHHVTSPEVLRRAVEDVGQGGCYIDPDVVTVLVQRGPAQSGPLSELTPRELEVLELMAQGRDNGAIAHVMVVTDRAVEKHINSIFAKLGLTRQEQVHRRVTAVLMYLDGRSLSA